jgi:hypothetical protein
MIFENKIELISQLLEPLLSGIDFFYSVLQLESDLSDDM